MAPSHGAPGWVTGANAALLTDLYELTMAQVYFDLNMDREAVFSLFVRRLPPTRNYLLACGLDTVLTHLENLRFADEDIAYLSDRGLFSAGFLEHLKTFRFTGDVFAVPEGTPVFQNEPILEIVAPIAEGQIVETFVMNQISVQTVLASKAARLVAAAAGRPVIDFGARRMHGADAAVKAARAFHIAGVAATSNVLAGRLFDVPITGTMAHSFIEAFDREADAFRAFMATYPETVLLVDTYDTLAGVEKVVEIARTMGSDFKVRAIRLDSGDLAALARASREILDNAGLGRVEIFASGGLDEHAIAALLEADAPIDGFGVGTAMGVSDDAPGLDIAYKLCAYAGEGRLKLSAGKPILPGRKQLFRQEEDGRAVADIIARDGEIGPGRAQLQQVMRHGRRLEAVAPPLDVLRARAAAETARLPDRVRAIQPADPPYPVTVSAALAAFQADVAARVGR